MTNNWPLVTRHPAHMSMPAIVTVKKRCNEFSTAWMKQLQRRVEQERLPEFLPAESCRFHQQALSAFASRLVRVNTETLLSRLELKKSLFEMSFFSRTEGGMGRL